jgi:predicted PurR-regulated permease PerM
VASAVEVVLLLWLLLASGDLVYGKHLRLNPVAVFVGVLFWWTLWGVPGAFLAVPIIATAKVLGDHLPLLRPLGEFLGG